jgi:hypothetical protein
VINEIEKSRGILSLENQALTFENEGLAKLNILEK